MPYTTDHLERICIYIQNTEIIGDDLALEYYNKALANTSDTEMLDKLRDLMQKHRPQALEQEDLPADDAADSGS